MAKRKSKNYKNTSKKRIYSDSYTNEMWNNVPCIIHDVKQKSINILKSKKNYILKEGYVNLFDSVGIPLIYVTDNVLRESGYSDDEIKILRDKNGL